MIPERHQKQARRLDNCEMVWGWLVNGDRIISEHDDGNVYMNGDGDIAARAHMIDPATVEDVPVKPIFEKTIVGDYRCPNCNAAFIDGVGTTPYCGNCGQRLDWQ